MDNNGRPNHIEDYLVQLHTGQWFGWSDAKNKVYANLIIHDDSKTKPTEQECIDGLDILQGEDVEDVKGYVTQRRNAYPGIGDQLDLLWHSINNDAELKSKYFDFPQAILAVKAKHPK